MMKYTDEDDDVRILGGSQWKGEETRHPSDRKRGFGSWSVRKKGLCIVAAVIVVAALGLVISKFVEHRIYGFQYPLSHEQTEVIKLLGDDKPARNTGITYKRTSCLGVDLEYYRIEGLKAELRDSFPSVTDDSVFFITRSADYILKGEKRKIIGDFVQDGEILSKSNWRAGYFAILNGRAEIGIGRRPEMRNFILKEKGSMFRQLALVSAGVKCQSQYMLKGKVTRCAYVKTINGDLYFVQSVNPETLYGFSDALIELGAEDAVYVTGGAQENLFYRDARGQAHGKYEDDKSHKMVVWTRK